VLQAALFTVFAVCVSNRGGSDDGGDDDSDGASTALLLGALDVALVLCSMFFMGLEWREHRGQAMVLSNGFDLCDSLSAVVTAGCAIANATGRADRDALLVSSACAAFFLLVKAISLCRGFPMLANLVMVLVQNVRDMSGFAILLGLLLYFFTIMLMLLFADARQKANFGDDDQVVGLGGGSLHALGGFFTALLTTFDIAILGNFSPGSFQLSTAPWLSQLVFVVMMMGIMVVALNALIALLGDSFERVQDSKAAKTSRLRAQFVVEYLSMLPEGRRSAIERATMWTHQLVPQSEYERRANDGGASSEWQGRLAAMKSMMKSELVVHQKASDAKIDTIQKAIDVNQEAMGAKIGDLDAKIDAKIDANQKAIDEKIDAKMSELLDAIKVLSPPPSSGQAEEKKEVDEEQEEQMEVDEEQVKVDVSAVESQFPLSSAAALSLSGVLS